MDAPRPSESDHQPGTRIRRVNWSEDLELVRRRFTEYREWLADHRDPCRSADSAALTGLSQVDRQIKKLPGAYGPPRGDVLLAFKGGELAACGALRELDPKVGEIKRLYVRADHRGPGFGLRLTRALLERARDLGYQRVRVDTLPSMAAAIGFYQELGFTPIPAYWPHPASGALFFEYELGHRARRTRGDRGSTG